MPNARLEGRQDCQLRQADREEIPSGSIGTISDLPSSGSGEPNLRRLYSNTKSVKISILFFYMIILLCCFQLKSVCDNYMFVHMFTQFVFKKNSVLSNRRLIQIE